MAFSFDRNRGRSVTRAERIERSEKHIGPPIIPAAILGLGKLDGDAEAAQPVGQAVDEEITAVILNLR